MTDVTDETKPNPCESCGGTAAPVRFELAPPATVIDEYLASEADPPTERRKLRVCGLCAALWTIAARVGA